MATTTSPGPSRQIKTNTLLLGGLQLSKITKKNTHVPYNMRCWKCCPPSSTHFWHLFRKCAFTWVNSISEIQSISCLILAFNSSNAWGFVAYTESFIYQTQQQMAVTRGLAWPACRFMWRQTAAARKHSICFLVQFLSNCHVH